MSVIRPTHLTKSQPLRSTLVLLGPDGEPIAFTSDDLGGVSDEFLTRISGGGDIVHAHGNAGATETVDPALGNVHTLTLDANLTLTLTGPATGRGRSILLKLTQDGTGGRTVTWPGSVVWPDGIAPTIAPAAGAVTFVTLFTTDGGTTWYGFAAGGGAAVAALDDLTDVVITAAATADRLRYDGSAWRNSNLIWKPVMDGSGNVVTDSGTGEAIVTEVVP